MKKLCALFCAILLFLSLSACGASTVAVDFDGCIFNIPSDWENRTTNLSTSYAVGDVVFFFTSGDLGEDTVSTLGNDATLETVTEAYMEDTGLMPLRDSATEQHGQIVGLRTAMHDTDITTVQDIFCFIIDDAVYMVVASYPIAMDTPTEEISAVLDNITLK